MKSAGRDDNWGDEGGVSAELFNRATLELTFTVLRKPYPALALCLQNTMTLAYPRHDYHTGLSASELPLTTGQIDRIALALSELTGKMTQSATPGVRQAQLVLLRSLLLDWLMLARDRNRSAEPLPRSAHQKPSEH